MPHEGNAHLSCRKEREGLSTFSAFIIIIIMLLLLLLLCYYYYYYYYYCYYNKFKINYDKISKLK